MQSADPLGSSVGRVVYRPPLMLGPDATTPRETAAAAPSDHSAAEPCWRCGTAMEWRHATLQCPRCHFKIGCCEGPTAECSPRDR